MTDSSGSWQLVRCRRCDLPLTRAVRIFAPAHNPITEQDGADGLPPGLCFRVETDDVWNNARPGSLVVHHGDLHDLVGWGDRTGCCGPTGSGGPNLACAGGHVVATEVADCWTPRFAFFEPNAIVLTPAGSPRDDVQIHTFHPGPGMTDAWPFHTWLHQALAATDWFGDRVEALVAHWLAGHTDSVALIFHASAQARASHIPVDELVTRIRAAQPEAPPVRCTLVLA